MLGASRQRVSQLASSVGFRAPEANLAAGPVWEREAVEEWAKAGGRSVRS
jgi:hypothetical protein